MLSAEDIAAIKKEIARLEKALADCSDGGVRRQIQGWIAEQKNKLTAHTR
jgi:hypothetical protein